MAYGSAIGVVSGGSGGLIEDDAAFEAWVTSAAQPPRTLGVLGVELTRDGLAGSSAVVWVAILGAMHSLVAQLYRDAVTGRAEWSVALLHYSGGISAVARGRASTLADAEARCLRCAAASPEVHASEALPLLCARLPAPPRVPDASIVDRAAALVAHHERSEMATVRAGAR